MDLARDCGSVSSPPAVSTGEVQNEQRCAAMGMTLRHSGHARVVASTGLALRACMRLYGTTKKKYTPAAMNTKEITAVMKVPYRIVAAVDGEDQRVEVGLAERDRDDRVDEVFDKRADHRAERDADDEGDGELNDVALAEEGTKTLHDASSCPINDWKCRLMR